MRLKPIGWKVYVRMDDAEEGINVSQELANMGFQIRRGMDEVEIRRAIASEDMGTIVCLGPLCWMRQDLQGARTPDQWEAWAKVGDKIIFGRHAGKLVKDPDTGEWFMMINDEDVQSVIDKPDFTGIEQELESGNISQLGE